MDIFQTISAPCTIHKPSGAGVQCRSPNFCPGFVQYQKMSSKCLTFVLIMSLLRIWLGFGLKTQSLSSLHLIFTLCAAFCPTFVPNIWPKSMEKLKDKTWTNIRLHYLSTKNLVTLQLDKDWISCRHLEVHKMSNVCPFPRSKYVYITVSEAWTNLGQIPA